MEYQKIANFLKDESNKTSKFGTKNWVEIDDDIRGAYSPNKQIRFKTSMLSLVYVIIVMHIYMLKGIYQGIILLLPVLMQTIPIKKQYLKIVLHLLAA